MRDFGLMPADAAHLALAELGGGSFVTADADFDVVQGPAALATLQMLKVAW